MSGAGKVVGGGGWGVRGNRIQTEQAKLLKQAVELTNLIKKGEKCSLQPKNLQNELREKKNRKGKELYFTMLSGYQPQNVTDWITRLDLRRSDCSGIQIILSPLVVVLLMNTVMFESLINASNPVYSLRIIYFDLC